VTVIYASYCEHALIAKGISLGEDRQKIALSKQIHSEINNKNNNRHKSISNINNNNDDKFEMNRMNNNNENEYEMNKTHQDNDLHKLGECGIKVFNTQISYPYMNSVYMYLYIRTTHALIFNHKLIIKNLGFSTRILLCFAYGSNSKVILSAKKNSEVRF
jgi:hypothetical protein